jgi:hypothetical protein
MRVTLNNAKTSPCSNSNLKTPRKKQLDLFLLNGIGDIIYTFYKLQDIIKSGYRVNVFTTSSHPQRSHQILGSLEGMISFRYLHGCNTDRYFLIDPENIFNPNPRCLFAGMPVLHINSWLESNIHMQHFLPQYSINYDIQLNTSDDTKKIVEKLVDKEKFNILLYSSNYRNNINCKMHPNLDFWLELSHIVHEWKNSGKKLHIDIVGADYDSDLTQDIYEEAKEKNIDISIHINRDFHQIIELIRNSNFVITYESGIGMIADVVKTPCLEIFRCQGGGRNDQQFPYLGPINPEGIWKRFYPFFYSDTIDAIENRLEELE